MLLQANTICFFCYQHFLIFSHITQHSIQNITKQNNRHILNISRSNQKGGREGRTIKTEKSLLYTITYIKQKTLPSTNGQRPGPTALRRCTFTRHYLQEATVGLQIYKMINLGSNVIVYKVGLQIYKMINLGSNVIVYKLKHCVLHFEVNMMTF